MSMKKFTFSVSFLFLVVLLLGFSASNQLGKYAYEDFETPEYCGTSCHNDFYGQWKNSMMSKAFTHDWDEIEYFKLAVPHAEKVAKLAGLKADCMGCHAPMSYLAGDIPPSKPEEGTRANEAVSCEVCHNITGFEGDIPFNFNYIMDPGETKYSSRMGKTTSPNHTIKVNPIMKTGDFCGICHNEKSPYGVWVKSTQIEWKEGPYSKEGVQCQDCHMPKANMRTAAMGAMYVDARTHLFHGAHSESKIRGAVEVQLHTNVDEAPMGDPVEVTATLFNQKAGHKIPTGSVEDRILWLHVEAVDEAGNSFHLPVNKKGFEGEEYTIAGEELAYQDMGVPLELPNFKGVRREDVPVGDRIFRMAYFDPEGRMTMQQWNTASLGVDYRIGPRESKIETYTFEIPYEITPGKVTINAKLYYRLLVKPVADLLKVPESESAAFLMNQTSTVINVF